MCILGARIDGSSRDNCLLHIWNTKYSNVARLCRLSGNNNVLVYLCSRYISGYRRVPMDRQGTPTEP